MAKNITLMVCGSISGITQDARAKLGGLDKKYNWGKHDRRNFPVTVTFAERERTSWMNSFLDVFKILFGKMSYEPPDAGQSGAADSEATRNEGAKVPLKPVVTPEYSFGTALRGKTAGAAPGEPPNETGGIDSKGRRGGNDSDDDADDSDDGARTDYDVLVRQAQALKKDPQTTAVVTDAARALRELQRHDGVLPHPASAAPMLHPVQVERISGAIAAWRRQGIHHFPEATTGPAKLGNLLGYLTDLPHADDGDLSKVDDTGGFALTQLLGWLSLSDLTGESCAPQAKYKDTDENTNTDTDTDRVFSTTLGGTLRHELADYQAGARFDILGPDGSQLASCRLGPEQLRIALLNAQPAARRQQEDCDKALQVELSDVGDLLHVLEQRIDKSTQQLAAKVVRGRIWRSDGLPLGIRSFAVFAPPAFAHTLDPCCGTPDLGMSPHACDDPLVPELIQVPSALAVAETDEAGYFEFHYSETAHGFAKEFVLLHVAGARAALVVQLVPANPCNDAAARWVFPDPLLLPCDAALLAPVEHPGGEFDTDDLDDTGNCKGLQLDQATRILEEYDHQFFIRTSDPAVTVSQAPHTNATEACTVEPDNPDAYFRARLDRAHRIDWDRDCTMAQSDTVAHGRILTFKQVWRSDGYSLGDLLYSLPLAPLQKKNIAVIDWARTETATLHTSQEYRESFRNEQSRDRDISEIVRSTLSESTQGQSQSGSRAGSSSSGLLGAVFGGSSGGGSSAWSSSNQHSSRSLASNFMNQLRDRTNQAANSYKSLRMTTVQQVNQSESAKAVTETVANRNACHAITIQYFEVLRHFRVDYELSAVRECLFIPMRVGRFDVGNALRWRANLAQYVPGDDLRRGFEALSRLHDKPTFKYPPGSYAEEPIRKIWGQLELTGVFPIPEPLKTQEDYTTTPGYELIDEFPEAILALLREREPTRRAALFDKLFASLLLERLSREVGISLLNKNAVIVKIKAAVDKTYRRNDLASLQLAIDFDLDTSESKRSDITELQVHLERLLPKPWAIAVTEVELSYSTDLLDHALVRGEFAFQQLGWRELPNSQFISVKTPATRLEKRNPRDEDETSKRQLLAHLNQNLEYYHKVIWWTMDPDRRYGLLDRFIAPNSGGRSVASVVENRIAGIVGNSLVMPLAPGMRLDSFNESIVLRGDAGQQTSTGKKDADKQDEEDLLAAYLPSIPNPSTRVSVPTRGVFAESILGGCNGCEQIDDSRNWRYWEHALPDEPPPIGQIDLATRKTDKGFEVPEWPESPIKQGEPLPAPIPSTLEQIAQILSAANAFRDMAGLAGTQQNAQEALKGSFETTQKAYAVATEAVMEGVKAYFTNGASLLTKKVSPGDAAKLKSDISKDVKAGRVTPEQGRASISRINDAVADSLSGNVPKGLLDKPEVASAIGAAAVRGSSLSFEQGNARIDLGASNDAPPAPPKSRLPWPLRLFSPREAEAAPPLQPTDELSFAALAKGYPTQSQDEFFKQLGGQWPTLVNNPYYKNTCAIRLSVAMKRAGVKIPTRYRGEGMEGDGSPLIVKVATFNRFVEELLGKPGWTRSKRRGEKIALPALAGLIMYRGDWGLATGHFDLWTGTGFVGHGNYVDLTDSHFVALWPLA